MPIRTTPNSIHDFVRHAEEVRDLHLEPMQELWQRFVGSAYRGGMGKAIAEPHVFEYLSLAIPETIFENPQYELKARRMGGMGQMARAIATALGYGLNQWVRDVRLRETLMVMAYDFHTLWAAGLVTQKPVPGFDPSQQKNLHRPEVSRIPQEWFFFDPMCMSFRNAGFVGHKYAVDREQKLEEARSDRTWNRKLLQTVKASPEDLHPDEGLRRGSPDRDSMLICEVWVPDATKDVDDHPGPENGYHGTIYTLAVTGEREPGDYLRQPMPYYGPACGPYVFGGVYQVRNSPFPLSPLVGTMDQQNDVSDIAESIQRSAANYKRGIIVNDKGGLAQAIREFKHDTVMPIPAFMPEDVLPVEVGGVTPQQLEQLQIQRERLARASAMNDARRGDVTGKGTATENAIADQTVETRASLPKAQFADVARQIGYIAAYHLYHDDRVVFELDDDTLEEMGYERANPDMPVMYYGGADAEAGDLTFDDIDLTIDVYSMERTSTPVLQRNMNQVMSTVVEAAAIMPQAPYLRWDKLLDDFGNVYNVPNMGEYVDMNMLMMMGVPVSQPQPTPVLAGDTSKGRQEQGQQPAQPQKPAMQQGAAMGAQSGAARRAV